MAGTLTTVATFHQAAQAELAKNVLTEAGIDAVVADAEIVAMDWLLANAVGGIKVQVRQEDADRAAAVLDKQLGGEAGLASEDLDEDELARQALAAGPEEDDVEDEAEPEAAEAVESQSVPPSPDDPPEIDRDSYATRAFIVAWFALVIWPLAFYALYLSLNAVFGHGRLTPLGRLRLFAVVLLVGLSLAVCWIFMMAFGIAIRGDGGP